MPFTRTVRFAVEDISGRTVTLKFGVSAIAESKAVNTEKVFVSAEISK